MSASHQQIRFCTAADGVRLAYAAVGEGPPLVKAANWLTHLQHEWQSPVWRHWIRELSRGHTLVRYDERGCGLSDWAAEDMSFEAWVRDLETVVDALELERFPLLGLSQGGPVAVVYAVRHPERVSHLIIHGSYDLGWGKRPEASSGMQWEALTTLIGHGWRQKNSAFRQVFTSIMIPEGTPEQARWFEDLLLTTSPEAAVQIERACSQIDVRGLLPQVQAPTLVLHPRGDASVPFSAGQRLAEALPNARFVPLESNNHILLEHEPAWPQFLAEVRAFLGTETSAPDSRDSLSALFERAVALPAEARRSLLDDVEDAALRAELDALLAADAAGGDTLDAVIGGAVQASIGALYGAAQPGEALAHYRIEERLGSGGMGEVFRARDTRLGRAVALKFLPAHLSLHADAKRRFIREARAASALDHPNICTIYDVVETDDGRLFIAMACYDGETLRAKVARGPLPVPEAVGYAAQIADGLACAHAAGIVHRDVKPANVIVTGEGHAKLLDFGIAKVAGLDVTRTGMTVGTAAYMSPEQARGAAVDHRTDVWSLGVVLYEMLAGRRPFPGEHDQAVLYAILNEEPPPLRSLRPEVPGALARLVHGALAKRPEDRPADAAAFVGLLREGPLERPGDHAVQVRSAPQAPLASWAGESASASSVVVLPFADMSARQDQAYFCEGIAEELRSALSRIEGLRVASRPSSSAFRNTSADIREIVVRLQVGAALKGSVRKAGDRLRVTVQLVSAADGHPLWSGRYDRKLEDVFAVQEEIVEHTVCALRGALTDEDRRALRQAPPPGVRAYDYYLRGRSFFYKQTKRDHEFARELFLRAIEADPRFARAYSGLSDCCAYLFKHFDHDPDYLDQAEAASRRAVELAPGLGEAHASRGLCHSLQRQDADADREFEAALRLGPRGYEVYYLYAVHKGYMQGELERAAELFALAAAVRPDDYEAPLLQAAYYRGGGRWDEAHAAYRQGLHLARRHLELNPDDTRALYLSANALVALGDHEGGLALAARAVADTPAASALLLYNMAAIHALAGDVDRGLDFLERAVHAGYAQREPIVHDPDLALLRAHPRFRALVDGIAR